MQPGLDRGTAGAGRPRRQAEPLRICYMTYPPERYSGGVFHAFWLAERLTEQGAKIQFLSYARAPRALPKVQRGFDVHYLRVPGWLGSYGEIALWPQLVGFFWQHRFDVVHVHSCGYREAFAPVAARMSGTASVGTIMQQGSDLAFSGRFETPVHRRLLRAFDRMVPISDETRAEALGIGFPDARLRTIPIGVDITRFRPASPERRRQMRARLGLPADPQIVTYVGGLNDRKNVLWLVDEWLASPAAARGAHLLVVGDVTNEPEGEAVRARFERRIRDGAYPVHWIRFVSEIEQVYAASDVFVLASLREGMPSVVTQAMASALPVISTPVAGVPELLGRHGERGLVFEFNDRPAFHRALDTLLGDQPLRRALGLAARAHVETYCSLDRVAAAYLDLYREIADQGSAAPR